MENKQDSTSALRSFAPCPSIFPFGGRGAPIILLGFAFALPHAFSHSAPPHAAYIVQLDASSPAEEADNYEEILPRFIYGICWRGAVEDNLKFAKQMGHSYVVYPSRGGMEDSPLSADLHFLLHKPEDVIYSELGLPRIIKIGETYTPLQQELFSKHFALKSIDAPFPDNIATGWFNFDRHGAPVSFAVVPDFQQMKVQELILNRIVERVKALERPDKGFLCGGMAWDEGELEGDFCTQKDGRNSQASLAVWNGEESSALYPGNTHEFATHSDARAAFFIELKKRMQSLFPQRNLVYMLEPYAIYKNWIEPIEMRPDRFDLMKDTLLYSEGEGAQLTAFADDPKIFASGLATRDRVGSTEPNEHGFEKIKEIVGKAGIHGSWFGWFGRFDKSGQGQTNNIQDIPRWHQLARAIPGWDNLCGVPLDRRSWDGDSYSSANSGMSDSVIYSRQPKTRKIFAVFLDGAGFVPLKPGETVAGIKRVDSFFCETEDGSEDVEILPDRIILKSSRRALASSK